LTKIYICRNYSNNIYLTNRFIYFDAACMKMKNSPYLEEIFFLDPSIEDMLRKIIWATLKKSLRLVLQLRMFKNCQIHGIDLHTGSFQGLVVCFGSEIKRAMLHMEVKKLILL
ncbi:hypothetical protein ACJX0J_021993, partial [Zea mays]